MLKIEQMEWIWIFRKDGSAYRNVRKKYSVNCWKAKCVKRNEDN